MIPLGLRAILFRTFHYGTRCRKIRVKTWLSVFLTEIKLPSIKVPWSLFNSISCFLGVGIATMVLVFFLDIYYCVIIAWTIFYMIATFSKIPKLPWDTCGKCTVQCRDGGSFAKLGAQFTSDLYFSLYFCQFLTDFQNSFFLWKLMAIAIGANIGCVTAHPAHPLPPPLSSHRPPSLLGCPVTNTPLS